MPNGCPATITPKPAGRQRRSCVRAAGLLATRGLLALPAAFSVATCSGGSEREPLFVFAASSLADAFAEMEAPFEADHPGIDLRLVFAGSHVLKVQIEEGAPADVFASADRHHVEALARVGLVADYRPIAGNELTVIVPTAGPAAIGSFADLPRAERLVIGTAATPLGSYTLKIIERSRERLGLGFEEALLERVVSKEGNARLVRAKVEMGAADAAIVYRTDVEPGRVREVPIPEWVNVRAQYVMAILTDTPSRRAARQWLRYVAMGPGRESLLREGFLPSDEP